MTRLLPAHNSVQGGESSEKVVFGSAVHGCGERGDGGLLSENDERQPTASPMATNVPPTNSPMATAEVTAEPSPAATAGATDMTPAQAGKLAEKIAQAVQQISEVEEAKVVVNNGRALVAVKFDAQYSAGLDDRMKQQIIQTVQKVDDTLKDVEVTDDDTLYGQIKGLGERVANVTGLDELADDFGDLWDRIVGR